MTTKKKLKKQKGPKACDFAVLVQVPKQVTISLKAEDIIKGEFSDTTECAIARAVRRTLGDSPEVTESDIVVEAWGGKARFKTPKSAAKFIERFDVIGLNANDWRHKFPSKQVAQKVKKARAGLKPITFTAQLIEFVHDKYGPMFHTK